MTSCDQCGTDPIEWAEDQLNNGNLNEELLFFSLRGSDIGIGISRFVPGLCQHPTEFTAEVDIMIITGEVTPTGAIIPTNQMYSQTIETVKGRRKK